MTTVSDCFRISSFRIRDDELHDLLTEILTSLCRRARLAQQLASAQLVSRCVVGKDRRVTRLRSQYGLAVTRLGKAVRLCREIVGDLPERGEGEGMSKERRLELLRRELDGCVRELRVLEDG